MSRIQLNDTPLSAAVKMSEGNPGAATVCSLMLKHGAEIDPDDAFEGFGNLLTLDTLEIYGSKIWMLFKHVCGQDLRVTCALLRANQLGYLSTSSLRHAIDNDGEGIDIPHLVGKVEKRLPRFQRAAVNNHVAYIQSAGE